VYAYDRESSVGRLDPALEEAARRGRHSTLCDSA
jgi:hypothetical protein